MEYLPHYFWHGTQGANNIIAYINDALDRFMEKNRDWNDISEPDKFNDIPGLHQRAEQILSQISHEDTTWMFKFEEIWNNKRIDFNELSDMCRNWADIQFEYEERAADALEPLENY